MTNSPQAQPSRLKSVCPDCGTVFERNGKQGSCDDCKPQRDHKLKNFNRPSPRESGYDYKWRKLSERARRISPFCEDCGATDDLTADHSVEAWRRKEQGKAIRLKDISVVCRRCNSERGAARGEQASDEWRQRPNMGGYDQTLGG